MTYDNGVACYLVTQSATLRVSVYVCLRVCVCFPLLLAPLFICFDGVLSSSFSRACLGLF